MNNIVKHREGNGAPGSAAYRCKVNAGNTSMKAGRYKVFLGNKIIFDLSCRVTGCNLQPVREKLVIPGAAYGMIFPARRFLIDSVNFD